MILRVYALYACSKPVLAFLMVMWVLQVTMSSIGITTGFAVPLPPGFVGCIFTSTNRLFPALWVTPLATDTCIFVLTILRARTHFKQSVNTPMLQLFIRDGLLYFLTIFSANLLNTLIFFLAPGDLKAVGASFSQLITATMISRLVLNLRSVRAGHNTDLETRNRGIITFVARTINQLSDDRTLDVGSRGTAILLKDMKTPKPSRANISDT